MFFSRLGILGLSWSINWGRQRGESQVHTSPDSPLTCRGNNPRTRFPAVKVLRMSERASDAANDRAPHFPPSSSSIPARLFSPGNYPIFEVILLRCAPPIALRPQRPHAIRDGVPGFSSQRAAIFGWREIRNADQRPTRSCAHLLYLGRGHTEGGQRRTKPLG